MNTSSSLGSPSCLGVGVGEMVATVALPGVAGPFTPICTWHKVPSFCHREGGSVCVKSSLHPALVSMLVSSEKGLDSSFSHSHLSSQLWPQCGLCPVDLDLKSLPLCCHPPLGGLLNLLPSPCSLHPSPSHLHKKPRCEEFPVKDPP